MANMAVEACSACGQLLGPSDETCPECGELTRLGLDKERATRREAGLAGFQRVAPRLVAIIVLFLAAAAVVYVYMYQSQIAALWQDVIRLIPLPTAGPAPVR